VYIVDVTSVQSLTVSEMLPFITVIADTFSALSSTTRCKATVWQMV